MTKAVKVIISDINSQSQKVGKFFEKIEQIGTISANNDQIIGALIAEAMKKVKTEGVITVKRSKRYRNSC